MASHRVMGIEMSRTITRCSNVENHSKRSSQQDPRAAGSSFKFLNLLLGSTSPVKTHAKMFAVSFLFLLGTACSESKPVEVDFVDVETNQVLNSEDLASLRLQGFNRLQADDYLVNSKDSLSVDLVFNLLEEDSTITLVSYTDSMLTKTGTSVQFKRSGANLEVDIFLQDYPMFHLCHLENFITKNNDVRLKVQLLNTTNFGPIISIWNQSKQFADGRKRSFNTFNLNTAECTSLGTTTPINTFGAGILWGFEVYKGKIKSAQRTEAYVL